MPRIVKTLISMALVGPSAGIEDDSCLLGDEDRMNLLQVGQSRRTHASIPVSSLDPMKTDHNLTVHDERDAQALQDVLEKAKQARDAAAEKVRLAEQAVEKANLQAQQRTRQADEIRAKASKDLQDAKAAQAVAATAMKSTEGRADRAFKVASVTANSPESSPGDFQEVSNATTATVVEAEDAEEKAKAAADAAAIAVASDGDASASGEKAREAEAARANKFAIADDARKHEANVRFHSRPTALEDDWAWQPNMEHADSKPIGWEGDYLVDSNNPLEPQAWGMKNTKQPMSTTTFTTTKNDATKKTAATQKRVVRGTLVKDENSLQRIGWRIPDEQTETGSVEAQKSPPQNLDDVVAKTKIADEKAIIAAAMAKDAANQSKVVLQKAQQVSDAATEELEKARAAEAAVKDAAASVAEHAKEAAAKDAAAKDAAAKDAAAKEAAAKDAAAKEAAAKDAAAAAKEAAAKDTDTVVKPTTRTTTELVDWERDYLVNDNNPLEPAAWKTTKAPPVAASVASSEDHTSTSHPSSLTTSALHLETILASDP